MSKILFFAVLLNSVQVFAVPYRQSADRIQIYNYCKDQTASFASSLVPTRFRRNMTGASDAFLRSYAYLLSHQRQSLKELMEKNLNSNPKAVRTKAMMTRVFNRQAMTESNEKLNQQIYVRTQKIRNQRFFHDCNFTDEEIFAIHMYTTQLYRPINKILRENDPSKIKPIEAFLKAFNSGLDKIAPYKGPVLRGTTLPDVVRQRYCINCVVSDYAYTSTSVSKQYSGKHWMKMESISGKFIAGLSSSPSVNEVLFLPNTQFQIKSVSRSFDPKGRPIEKFEMIELPKP